MKLKNNFIKQLIKYLAVSLSSGVVFWFCYAWFLIFAKQKTVFDGFDLGYYISVGIACVFAFTINRKYTFKNSNNYRIQLVIYIFFYAAISVPLAFLVIILQKAGWHSILAGLIAQFMTAVCEFTFLKLILFRNKQIPTAAENADPLSNEEKNFINEKVEKTTVSGEINGSRE